MKTIAIVFFVFIFLLKVSPLLGQCPNALITNNGFESGTSGYFSTGNGFTTGTPSRTGSLAARIVNNDSGFGQNVINLTPGQSFSFTGYFRTVGTPSWVGLGIDFKDVNWSNVSALSYTIVPNTNYTQFTLSGIVPTNSDRATIWFWKSGGGELFLDDLCITIGGAVSPIYPNLPGNCLSDFNFISFGNVNVQHSDIQGRVLIFGNAVFGNYSLADKMVNGGSDTVVFVSGSLNFNQGNVNGGAVNTGGAANYTNITSNSGNPTPPLTYQNVAIPYTGATEKAFFQAIANYYKVLPTNGIQSFSGNIVDLNANNLSGDVVFNLDLTANPNLLTNADIRLTNATNATRITINVKGLDLWFRSSGFNGQFLALSHKVMWNFYEATRIRSCGIGIKGSLLAPNAQLMMENGHVDGNVIVNGYVMSDGSLPCADGNAGEFHLFENGTNSAHLVYYLPAVPNVGFTGCERHRPLNPQASCPPGSLLLERWTGISSDAISALQANQLYPYNPNQTAQITSFQGPVSYGDNYGTRVRGYIIPTTTGSYTFTVTGDDAVQLLLGTDSTAFSKRLIAFTDQWTNEFEYTKFTSQTSTSINLVAGVPYYVELLHKEGTGGDHFKVFWQTPTNSTRTIIPSANLAPLCGAEITTASTCDEGVDLDLYYDGIEGESSSTLTFPNPSTITKVVVEVVYKGSRPNAVTVVDASNNNYTFQREQPQGGSNNVYIYRGQLPATSSVTFPSIPNNNGAQSIIAYVYRRNVAGKLVVEKFTNVSGFRDTQTWTFTIPAGQAPRNLVVKLPVSEVTLDNRVLNFSATAGSVTNSFTRGWGSSWPALPYGCCIDIVEIPLNNVPANVTQVTISMTSPNSNGQSYVISGTLALEVDCTCPPITIAPTSSTICVGGNVSFSSTNLGVAETYYKWLFNPGATPGNASGFGPHVVTFNQVGNANANLKVANDVCYEDLNSPVTVVSDPTVSILSNTAEVCVGGTVLFTANVSGGTGTCTIQWQRRIGTGAWTNISGANGVTYSANITNVNEQYRAQYICTGIGCCD